MAGWQNRLVLIDTTGGKEQGSHHVIKWSLGVLIATLLVGYSVDAAAVQQARSFCWRAALDQKTGEATATEISTPRRRSNRAGAQHVPRTSCDHKSLIDLLKSYPVWLSRPSVSFGILRTCELSKPRDVTRTRIDQTRSLNGIEHQGSVSGISISDSLLGLNLLCFGRARSIVTTCTAKTNGGNRRRSIQVEFPVIGGLLDGKRQTQAATSTNDISEHGCIRFVVEQEEVIMRDKRKMQQGRKRWSNVRIESSTCDGYCPAISGDAPVNPIRKVAYLSSQSLVHAYVMWRFHRKVWADTQRKKEK